MAKKEIRYGILYNIEEDDEFIKYIPEDAVKGEVKKVTRDVLINGEKVKKEVDAFFIYDEDKKETHSFLNMQYTTEGVCVDNIITHEELVNKYVLIPEDELLDAYFNEYKDCTICKQKEDYYDDEDTYEDVYSFRKDWLLKNPENITLSGLQAVWDHCFEAIRECEKSDEISENYDFLIDILQSMETYIDMCPLISAIDKYGYTNLCENIMKRLIYARDLTGVIEKDKKVARDLNKELREQFDDAASKTIVGVEYSRTMAETEKKEAIPIKQYKDINALLGNSKKTRQEILDELDKTVIGHDDAKIRLLSVIESNSKIEQKSNIDAVLLIGPSGCGKTLLVETLSKVMDKPFALIDTLALTPAGYKGVDLENVLALQLLRSAKGDVKKAERGVVFFDEFDKKASTSDKESNFDKRTIDQLLTYMSGTKCTVEYNGRDTEIDTSFITFVFGGSFADMIKAMMDNKETDESYKRTTIGFIKDTAKEIKDINEYDLKYPEKIEDEDLAVHGHMRPEMINRIPTKIVMQGENRISLKDILLYSTVSPLVFEEKRINAKGANLAVLEEFVDPFIESAFGRKQCGRSLKNGLFEITSLINDVLDEYPSRFKYAVLNKECVSNPRDALLIDYENNRYTVGELKDEIKKAKEGKTKESVIKTYAFIPEN